MRFDELIPAQRLAYMMGRIYHSGLTTTSGGNLSVRDDKGTIWITPGGIDKGSLTADDIIVVSSDGKTEGKHKPSVELPFHQAVYKARPDLKAIIHAHSPAIVACSLARILPRTDLLESISEICGKSIMAPYAMSGTDRLAEIIADGFKAGYNIVFLENHGVCIGAESLYDAYLQLEALEYAIELERLARRLGSPRFLEASRSKNSFESPKEFFRKPFPNEHNIASRLAIFSKRAVSRGLCLSNTGSISVRTNSDSFMITPHDDLRDPTSDDMRVFPLAGTDAPKSGAPNLHAKIYAENPNIGSIVIACPLHMMAYAVSDAAFDVTVMLESYVMLRDICEKPAALLHSNPDIAAKLFSERSPVVVFSNNCIVSTGPDLVKAFDRAEVAECTASSIIKAMDFGCAIPMNRSQTDEIRAAFGL